MQKKRILIIPHSTNPHVRTRLGEIGAILARTHEVFFLRWHETPGGGFGSRAWAAAKDLLCAPFVRTDSPGTALSVALLHRPLAALRRFNALQLRRLIIERRIDTLINGTHYFFFTPPQTKTRYTHIFDVNDLPAEEERSPLGRFAAAHACHEIAKASVVTTCSRSLTRYLQERYRRSVRFIPNGAHLNEFGAGTEAAAQAVRKRFGLEGKTVFGYVGNVAAWIDFELLLDAFKKLCAASPAARLLIVGDGPELPRLKQKHDGPAVVFTGGVTPSAIAAYLQAIDVGVLPCKKTLFQEMAFHTKLIDYTAARKCCVATDLAEIRELGFPSILTVRGSAEEWAGAMQNAIAKTWDPEWETLLRPYDWEQIAASFNRIIDDGS